MDRMNIHSALYQVREIKQQILDRQRFRGYSGRARAVGGTIALAAAAVMASPRYPRFEFTHEIGWSAVICALLAINYGALFWWFLFDREARRDVRRLKPVIDALPALIVGMMLTIALERVELYDYLFGVWMCIYGLANVSLRPALSDSVWPVGMYYILWGTLCLLVFDVSFMNPWIMGFVFFFGEWWGGIIFHLNRKPGAPLTDFFAPAEERMPERRG